MTYDEIEQQALDILQLAVPVITDWDRGWTNSGRREVQRRNSFEEMESVRPAEADIGASMTLTAGVRELAAPVGLKEEWSDTDGLFWMDGQTQEALTRKPFGWIAKNYDLDETGDPEVYYRERDPDTKDVTTFFVFPKPTAASTSFRVHGFFYMPDLAAASTGDDDWLSQQHPLLVRDLVLREAYLAMEMEDMALRRAQSAKARLDEFVKADRDRKANTKTIRSSTRAGYGRRTRLEDYGYPFWGRR